MRMALLYCVVLSLVAGLAIAAAVPVSTTQSHVCVKNGVTYNGTFHPSPCEYCHCSGGRPICAVMDCAFPQCADYEHLPGQCCPVCRQSATTCTYHGHVIKQGETYRPNSYTTCRCPLVHHHVLGHSQAICLSAGAVDHHVPIQPLEH